MEGREVLGGALSQKPLLPPFFMWGVCSQIRQLAQPEETLNENRLNTNLSDLQGRKRGDQRQGSRERSRVGGARAARGGKEDTDGDK